VDGLLQCENCHHGASAHSASGCETLGCACRTTLDEVIARGVAAAREEIRSLWGRAG
jgi:hypothetical protein